MRPLALACFVCIAGLALWAVDGLTIEPQPYGYDGERVTDPVPLGAWDELAPVGAGWRPVYQFLWHDPLDGHGPTKVSGLWPIGPGSRTERRPYGPGVTSLTERQGWEHEGLDGFARGGMRVHEGEDWLWNQWVFAERVRSWTARAEDGRVLLLSGPYEVMGNSIVLEFQLVPDGEAHALDESRGWRLLSMSVFDRGEHMGPALWLQAGGFRARFGVEGERVQVRFVWWDKRLRGSLEGRLTFDLPREATDTEPRRLRALGRAMGLLPPPPTTGEPVYGIEDGRVFDPRPFGVWPVPEPFPVGAAPVQQLLGSSASLRLPWTLPRGLHPIPRGQVRTGMELVPGQDWVRLDRRAYAAEPGWAMDLGDGRLLLRSVAAGEWYSKRGIDFVLATGPDGEPVLEGVHLTVLSDVGIWKQSVGVAQVHLGRVGDLVQLRFRLEETRWPDPGVITENRYHGVIEGRLTFDLARQATGRVEADMRARGAELEVDDRYEDVLPAWYAAGLQVHVFANSAGCFFVGDAQDLHPEDLTAARARYDRTDPEPLAALFAGSRRSTRVVLVEPGRTYAPILAVDKLVEKTLELESGRLALLDGEGRVLVEHEVEPGTYRLRYRGFAQERASAQEDFHVVEVTRAKPR